MRWESVSNPGGFRHVNLFLTYPSYSHVLVIVTHCTGSKDLTQTDLPHGGLCAVRAQLLGGTKTFPVLHHSSVSNIPVKSNCCWYSPQAHHWCHFCYIIILWFNIKGISSNSEQFVHILQVGTICHGNIKLLTQTHLLTFLSCSVRQYLKVLASEPPW